MYVCMYVCMYVYADKTLSLCMYVCNYLASSEYLCLLLIISAVWYRYMVKNGYDFYENSFLNGVFKRLVSVAAKGINADDLKTTDSLLLSSAMSSSSSPSGSGLSSSTSSSLKDIVDTLEEAVRSSNQKDNDGLVANSAYSR